VCALQSYLTYVHDVISSNRLHYYHQPKYPVAIPVLFSPACPATTLTNCPDDTADIMSSRPSSRPAGEHSDLCEGHFSGKSGHSNHPHLFAIKVKLVHSKHAWGKLKNVFNPNHRHDEPHEKEIDAWREEVANSHRYNSFAPVTIGNDVKWYVDGRDYFWAVSVALDNAKEVIYIEDWWLSPELFLRRPPSEAKEWRLDRVLKRKAEEGVKIFVIVYKEVGKFENK